MANINTWRKRMAKRAEIVAAKKNRTTATKLAKEYHDTEQKDRAAKADEIFERMMKVEYPQLVRLRRASYPAALKAILDQFRQRWEAFAARTKEVKGWEFEPRLIKFDKDLHAKWRWKPESEKKEDANGQSVQGNTAQASA